MTETVGIRQDVTNPYSHSTRQFRSRFLSSASGILPYKRKILDRWTERSTASGLAGDDLVAEYLHDKYIKNLSYHTIDHAGGVILAFLHFLNKHGSSIFTLTRSNISAFVEYEKDRGLKAISIISQLTVIEAAYEGGIIDIRNYIPKRIPQLMWRECIKKVWEVDPLVCPKCTGEMKIISFIYKRTVIKKILTHLNLYEEQGNQRAAPIPKENYTERVEVLPYDDGWPEHEKTVVEF